MRSGAEAAWPRRTKARCAGELRSAYDAAARGLAMWSQGAISGPSRSFHIVDFPDPLWPATTIAMGWPDAARRSNTCWTAAARVVVNGP